MLAFFYVSAFVVGAWAPFVWAHREVHGAVNPAHVALTLFNAVNLLICLWEHALFLHRGKIRREHARLKRKHGDRALPKPLCLFEDISLAQALSYEHWSIIWSQYSLLDPSYADQRSFGFWVDSGNGLVTLPATLLLSHAATYAGTSAYWMSTKAGRGGGHRVQLPDALRHRVVLLQLPAQPVRRRRVEGKRRDGDRRERHLDRLPALVDGGVLGRSDHGLVRGAEVMREV
jgi:hypothetical protein